MAYINLPQKLSELSNLPLKVDRRQPIDIADLVEWAYQVQKVDLADGPVSSQGYGATGVARVEQVGALGIRVDSFMNLGSPVHPDADEVHSAVLRLAGWRTGCLLDFGRSGLVPDPLVGKEPRARPVMGRTGYRMLRDHNRNPIACVITWDGPDWREIEFARTKYEFWHQALSDLADSLRRNGLSSYLVTGPSAIPRPWERRIDNTQKP
jgi:hypothetical protein